MEVPELSTNHEERKDKSNNVRPFFIYLFVCFLFGDDMRNAVFTYFWFFFFFISYVPDDATAAVLYVLSWKGDRFFFLLGAFIRLPHPLSVSF